MEQMNRLTSRCSKLKSSAARLRSVRRPSIAHPPDPVPGRARPVSTVSRVRCVMWCASRYRSPS